MAIPVKEIIRKKGNRLTTINGSATVYDAISIMVDDNVGSIIVVDDDEVRGIFTERDYLRRIALQGRTSKTTKVEDVMTEKLVVVDTANSVEDCMSIMTEKKCRHLPVIHDGRLVGVVSIGDCVRAISEAHKAQARYLEEFIVGRYPA